jgi:SAM-dependent methyltransferase
MNFAECQRMAMLEGTYWWYRGLHTFLLRRLGARLPENARVLDLGCGSGLLLESISVKLGASAEGIELNPELASMALARGPAVRQGCMFEEIEKIPGHFDAILLIDTLYFLSEEEQSLLVTKALSKLSPGGVLVCHLPAGNLFRREHDITVGIRRRFTPARARALFAQHTGVELRLRNRVCALSLGILLSRAWQRFVPAAEARSDLVEIPRWLNELLKRIQFIEDRLPAVPWGSSLYVEARKPI